MLLLVSLIEWPYIGRNALNGATFESSDLGCFQMRQADNLIPLFAGKTGQSQGPARGAVATRRSRTRGY
jgi:hypothetical protein